MGEESSESGLLRAGILCRRGVGFLQHLRRTLATQSGGVEDRDRHRKDSAGITLSQYWSESSSVGDSRRSGSTHQWLTEVTARRGLSVEWWRSQTTVSAFC